MVSSVRGSRAHGRSMHGSRVCGSPPLWGGLSQSALHKTDSVCGQLQSQSSCSILPDFEQPMVQHKAKVPPHLSCLLMGDC